MVSGIKKFLAEKWFIVAVCTIAVLQLVNLGVFVRNGFVIDENKKLQTEVEEIRQRSENVINRTAHMVDLGVRGFGLTKKDQLLDPFFTATKESPVALLDFESALKKQSYPRMEQFYAMKKAVEDYIIWSRQMIDKARADEMEEFNRMLEEDRGLALWKVYDEFARPLTVFEDKRLQQALSSYESAMKMNSILQWIMAILSIPTLFLIVARIQKERKVREQLMAQVAENDKNFVFNSGDDRILEASEIINQTISNTRKASNFVKSMANSDYNVTWEGLNEQNSALNADTLAGNLMNMRQQLVRVKQEDEKRNWMNEGLASFSELVRNNQHDSQLLADQCVSFLTKYLNGQQASLFTLAGDDENQHLQLVSCYAFNKKKFIEKTIDLGNGLIGQAFLEGETIHLKEIPSGYTMITSGLGDATPGHLLIVPLKYDIQTVAIFEIASFYNFEPHQILFIQKAGEFLASAILNSQNTQKMRNLLDQARINEEQMRQREEEMRQNMEELQATQEELVRKEKEMQKRLTENRMQSSF